MVKIFYASLLVFLCSSTVSAGILKDLQISKEVSAVNGSFSVDINIPSNDSIRVFIPNTTEIQTNNVEVIMPNGITINQFNATANNVIYSQTTHYASKTNGWKIDINNAPSGTYRITGSIVGSNSVPVMMYMHGSGIRYDVLLGHSSTNIRTGKWLPLTLFLVENETAMSNIDVNFDIYHNDVLVYETTAKDDGTGSDVKPDDGLYYAFFKPDVEGVYRVVIRIRGTNSNNEQFEGEIIRSFNVDPNLISISSDYLEETPDLDGDGYADELILSMPVTAPLPVSGVIHTYAKIKIGDKGYLDDFGKIDVSENKIYAKFDGHTIRKLGYSGVFNVERFHYKYNGKFIESFTNLKNTSYFDISVWERENLEFTTVFNDVAIDSNADNIFDAIRISFEVDSILDASALGKYGYRVKAYNQDGELFKEYTAGNIDLAVGINTIYIDIPASDIVVEGDSIQLTFVHLSIFPKFNADAILRVKDLGTTKVYYCKDFAGCKNREL